MVISLATLLKKDPSEIGALPDGVNLVTGATQSTGIEKTVQRNNITLRQALETKAFWLILVTWSLWALCLSLIMTHVVPYATDQRISTIEASTILSIMSVFSILSRLIVGRTSDIIGRKLPSIVCALLGATAFIWLIWAENLWMFYVFAVIFGLSWGGSGVINFTLAGDNYNGRNLGAIMGVLNIGHSVGLAVGSAFGGFVFDVTSSYVAAFAAGAAALLTMVLVFTVGGREIFTRTN